MGYVNEPAGRGSASGLRFALEIDAADDVAYDARRVDALATVSALGEAAATREPPFAEVLIMDNSLSMAARGKIGEAKRAACSAVDAVRDGALLGIVAGNHESAVVYPPAGGLARVDARVRKAAKQHVRALMPHGGTRIGRWLTSAAEIFATAGAGTVCHAALYTDGRNEHESPEELGDALTACADRFVCDVRGLGEDWDYAELLRITEALHGEARSVVDVADLTGDFTRLMERARRLVVPRVYLALRLNDRFRIGFVRQSRPVEADLTAQQQHDGREIRIPLGSWAVEARQYQLSLSVDPAALPVGQELLAARVTVLAETPDGTREPRSESQPLIVRRLATTDTPGPLPPGLTRAENVHDLGVAMRACANAGLEGDFEEADRDLREALQLARALGETTRLQLLEDVTVIGPDGLARVRRNADDLMRLKEVGIESTRTGPVEQELMAADAGAGAGVDVGAPPPAADSIERICPVCHETTNGPSVRLCENCGHPFDGEAAAP